MEVKPVRFTDGNYVHTVAIYKGIFPEELSKLLGTIFGLRSAIIGFLSEDRMVIPISLSCRSPEIFSGNMYSILMTEGEAQFLTLPQPQLLPISTVTSIPQALPPHVPVTVSTPPIAPLMPPSVPQTRPPERRESRASAARNAEVGMSEEAMDHILKFIAGLRVRALITKLEARSLEELLFDDCTLIYAAYSVASSANDAEYLAEIFIDLAQSLKTKSGHAAIAAQVDMLHVCDSLYTIDRFTKNQLLYLRHLILIREDIVANIYDEYQNHQSVDQMALDLYNTANMNADTNTNANTNNSNQNETYSEDVTDPDSLQNNPPSSTQRPQRPSTRPSAPSPMSSTLNNIIAIMMRSAQITSNEAAILLELVNAENEFVLAAFELYEQDNNEEDLKDTLMRCAKYEYRKRLLTTSKSTTAKATSSSASSARAASNKDKNTTTTINKTNKQKKKMNNNSSQLPSYASSKSDIEDEYEDDFEELTEEELLQLQHQNQLQLQQKRQELNKHYEDDDGEDEDEDDSNVDVEDDDEDDSNVDGDVEDDDGDDRPHVNAFSEQLAKHLEELLSTIGVENTWDEIVPQQFIFTVFAAAHKSLMTIGHAKALCDLFQAQYDLVRAAWEVYSVQGDVRDFTDTLLRIVRDLDFDSDTGELDMKNNTTSGKKHQNSTSSSVSSYSTDILNSSSSFAREKALQKKHAKAAVEEAKRDLLKHSLEMMIKQEMTEPESASLLFERALRGDVLIDAAIECYAGNRNVSEFLDTLQILANNSPEDIDQAMRAAVAREMHSTSASTSDNNILPPQPPPLSVHTSTARSSTSAQSSPVKRSPNAPFASQGPNSHGSSGGGNSSSMQQQQHRSPAPSPNSSTRFSPNNNINSNSNNNSNTDSSDKDTKAFAELRTVVMQMTSDNIIDYDTRVVLLRLIASGDDRIMAAHDVFREFHDMEDLIDSLVRIAIRELRGSPNKKGLTNGIGAAPAAVQNNDEDSDEEDEEDDEEDSDDEEEEEGRSEAQSTVVSTDRSVNGSVAGPGLGLLNSSDQKNILEILSRAGALPKETLQDLGSLINHNDDRVQLVFLQYEQDKDVYRLIESLKAIHEDDNDNEEDEDDDEDEDDEDDDDGDDEDDEENDGDESAREFMDARFLSIVKGMNLSHLETAALRLAIARDDSSIRGALEVFRESTDEDELIETLRTIARRTIEDTMMEAQDDNQDDDEESEDEDEENEQEGAAAAGGGSNGNGTRHPQNISQDGTSIDDNDNDNDDNNTDSITSDQRLMSSQAARDHVFPILINELVREQILYEKDGLQLLQQFAAGNTVINAALDIYDLDSDMAELVDTLQRVAKACEGQ